jgi:hypothetical protein
MQLNNIRPMSWNRLGVCLEDIPHLDRCDEKFMVQNTIRCGYDFAFLDSKHPATIPTVRVNAAGFILMKAAELELERRLVAGWAEVWRRCRLKTTAHVRL